MRTENNSPMMTGYHKRRIRYITVVVILSILVMILAAVMMVYGNTVYPLKTVWQVLLGEEIQGAGFTVRDRKSVV